MSFDTVIPYAAGADLSAKQFFAVQDDGSGNAIAISADTQVPIGILQNKPTSGKSCSIDFSGVSKAILGGNVVKGDLLGPTTTGALVKRTLGTDLTKYVCARAGAAGSSGDIIPVVLIPVPFRAT